MARKLYLTALLTVLVLAGPTWADEMRGVVTRVEPAKNELAVEGRGKQAATMTFTLNKDSRILFGRKAGELTDVTIGRRVRVRYEMKDGQRLVSAVHVRGTKQQPDNTNGKAITGTLRRISVKDRQIVVLARRTKGAKEAEVVVRLPENVKLMRAGKAIGLDDLKEGVRVRIMREDREGKEVIASVEVLPQQTPAITRVRQALQLTDFILKMFEKP